MLFFLEILGETAFFLAGQIKVLFKLLLGQWRDMFLWLPVEELIQLLEIIKESLSDVGSKTGQEEISATELSKSASCSGSK